MKPRAVIFDIDETLSPEISWISLTRDLGASVPEHLRLYNGFQDGSITYEASRAQLINLWRATGRATRSQFQSIFAAWPLDPAAKSLVNQLQAEGYKLALITGSFDAYAKVVAGRLGIKHYYANTPLYFDEQGNIAGYDYVTDQAGAKLIHCQKFCVSQRLKLPECIAIGDADNDLELFRATGHGIMIKGRLAHPALEAAAWKVVNRLEEVKEIMASS